MSTSTKGSECLPLSFRYSGSEASRPSEARGEIFQKNNPYKKGEID